MAEARAMKRSIQSSPRKMRLMLDMIRGKRVSEAISLLHFTPNHASIVAEQTLRSAVANFQTKPEHAGIDIEDLWVRECYADGGAMLKRIMPAPMGRAFRVRKRSNHLTIVISDKPLASQVAKMSRRDRKAFEGQVGTPAPQAAKPARKSRAKVAAAEPTPQTSSASEAQANAPENQTA